MEDATLRISAVRLRSRGDDTRKQDGDDGNGEAPETVALHRFSRSVGLSHSDPH